MLNRCKKPVWLAGDKPALQWHHNEHGDFSNRQRPNCLLNILFGRRSKKTPKLSVTGLCDGNPPVTGGFPSKRTSNAENVSSWWCHQILNGQLTGLHALWVCSVNICKTMIVPCSSTNLTLTTTQYFIIRIQTANSQYPTMILDKVSMMSSRQSIFCDGIQMGFPSPIWRNIQSETRPPPMKISSDNANDVPMTQGALLRGEISCYVPKFPNDVYVDCGLFTLA